MYVCVFVGFGIGFGIGLGLAVIGIGVGVGLMMAARSKPRKEVDSIVYNADKFQQEGCLPSVQPVFFMFHIYWNRKRRILETYPRNETNT